MLGTRAVAWAANASASIAGIVATADTPTGDALAMARAGRVDTNSSAAVEAGEAGLALANTILAGAGSRARALLTAGATRASLGATVGASPTLQTLTGGLSALLLANAVIA